LRATAGSEGPPFSKQGRSGARAPDQRDLLGDWRVYVLHTSSLAVALRGRYGTGSGALRVRVPCLGSVEKKEF
jgi:hypothetical protein